MSLAAGPPQGGTPPAGAARRSAEEAHAKGRAHKAGLERLHDGPMHIQPGKALTSSSLHDCFIVRNHALLEGE